MNFFEVYVTSTINVEITYLTSTLIDPFSYPHSYQSGNKFLKKFKKNFLKTKIKKIKKLKNFFTKKREKNPQNSSPLSLFLFIPYCSNKCLCGSKPSSNHSISPSNLLLIASSLFLN